jgi:AraC-like DNA-binding protein
MNNDQTQNLKQLLAQFVTSIQQTGIIEGVTPEPQPADQLTQALDRIAALEKRVEALSQDLYTKEEVLKYLREQGMGGGMTKEEVVTVVMDDPKVSQLIKDVVTEEIEPRLEDYDDRATEIAKEVVSESDPFANMRHGSTAWNNIEAAVDRVLDDKDFEDIVQQEIRNMDLHDHLDESRLVDMVESNMDIDDKVNDLINEYDFSEALRNTLADADVKAAIEGLVLKALVKRLSGEVKAKDEAA